MTTESAAPAAPAKRAPRAAAATAVSNDPTLPLPPGCGPTLAAVSALDAALLEAQAKFGVVLKDADNPYFKSSYVSLPGLLALVRPILRDHNVLISSSYQLVAGVGFTVSTTVSHTLTGGWRVSTFPVPDPCTGHRISKRVAVTHWTETNYHLTETKR
jgi:hypothetical protein